MKKNSTLKSLCLFASIFTVIYANSQNTILTGNVGIGTSNVNGANNKLFVAGGGVQINMTSGTSASTDASLHIVGSTGCCNRLTQFVSWGANTQALNLIADMDGSMNSRWYSWGVYNGVYQINPGTNFNNTPFSINAAGNVGIGTTTPATKLDIAVGNLGTAAGNYIPLTRLISSTLNQFFVNDFVYRENAGSDWTSTSYIKGISVDNSFLVPGATLKSWIKQKPIDNRIEFGSDANTYMSIVGGNVGIGTAYPGSKLSVNGDVSVTASGTYGNYLNYTYSNTDWHGARIGFNRFRGTSSAATAVVNNDMVGWFDYFAYDGANSQRVGQFLVAVDGTVSPGIVPGRFLITTANASGVNTTRLTAYANDNIIMATNGGSVGIGTSTPSSWGKLTVAGNLVFANDATDYLISGPANGGAIRIKSNGGTPDRYLQLGQIDNNKTYYPSLTVADGGNIGIGTTDTKGYKLAVAGSAGVIAEKFVVKKQGNWPDYVFGDEYKLRSLTSLEEFISTNKHLPEVPSVSDIEKDGLDIGTTQAALLKKIEELTLYVKSRVKKYKSSNR